MSVSGGGLRVIGQSKRWQTWAGWVGEMRGVAGTLVRQGLNGSAGLYVTLSDFTEQARAEAQTIGLTLVDNRDLFARVEKTRRREPCPICQEPMILDRSSRGWWLRWVASGCQGKRALGSDPRRA